LALTVKLVFATFILALVAGISFGQDTDSGHHDDDHHHGLHFSHPLITESASPDTKLRFDYDYERLRTDDGDRSTDHAIRVEYEYAFARSFSVAVTAPYVFRRTEGFTHENHFDNVEISLKAASFAFAEKKILPVYGISFGLPTGNDSGIGSNHVVEIEPFAGLGVMKGNFEFIGFGSFGFRANRHAADEEGNEFGYHFSTMYKFSPRFQGLLEFDGHNSLTGETANVLNISPGIKFIPAEHWQIGAGVGFPLTHDKDFNVRGILSVFYHF
jgi:hypothetical protein